MFDLTTRLRDVQEAKMKRVKLNIPHKVVDNVQVLKIHVYLVVIWVHEGTRV